MFSLFHYLAELVAVFVGVRLYMRSREQDTLREEQRLCLLIGALIGALIGSRLVAALEDPALFLQAADLLYYVTGKTIIGGIAGGIVGIEAVKKILGISVWTGDRTLIPLAVAIIIGRIGCFVAGVEDHTVGGPCDYLWCLEQGDGILRHPNSLYEIVFLSLFLIGYRYVKKYQPPFLLPALETPGVFFRIFIVGYFSLRFCIEFLKETNPLWLHLNSVQLVCVLFVLWYAKDIFRVYVTARRNSISTSDVRS